MTNTVQSAFEDFRHDIRNVEQLSTGAIAGKKQSLASDYLSSWGQVLATYMHCTLRQGSYIKQLVMLFNRSRSPIHLDGFSSSVYLPQEHSDVAISLQVGYCSDRFHTN